MVLDVETTGLSAAVNEVVELGMVIFDFDRRSGNILRVVEEYAEFRQPSHPIPREATMVHKITNAMVRGKVLDDQRVVAALTQAEFIVAHNAAFDYRFMVKLYPQAAAKTWLCSMRHIPWYTYGFPSRGLQNLLAAHRIPAQDAHRAKGDCLSTLALLGCLDPNGQVYFRSLLQRLVPDDVSP